MSKVRKYSACLQNTDRAGIVRVRTDDTEDDYRKRLGGMHRRLARQKHEPHVEIGDVIDDVVGRAANLKTASFNLYRAVFFQGLRDDYDNGRLTEAEAIALTKRLDAVNTTRIGSCVKSKRTSAGRRRHIRPEVVSSLAAAASRRTGATMQNLSEMLEYGVMVGLRPCEFIGAKLDGRELTVRCAKFSEENQRGLAPQRPLILLDAFDEADLERLGGLFARLAVELEAAKGDRELLVRRYAEAFHRIRVEVPAAGRTSLYTARHQFRANMVRAGFSAAEIAAAMGHASAQTNSAHYGRGNKGWRPVFGEKPIDVPAKLVARVRVGARAKAKAAAEQRARDLVGGESKAALLLPSESCGRRDEVAKLPQQRSHSNAMLGTSKSSKAGDEHELDAKEANTPMGSTVPEALI